MSLSLIYYVLSTIAMSVFAYKLFKLTGEKKEWVVYVLLFVPVLQYIFIPYFIYLSRKGIERANTMMICTDCDLNFRAGASSFLNKDENWLKIKLNGEEVDIYYQTFTCPNCQSNETFTDRRRTDYDIPTAPKFDFKKMILLQKQTMTVRNLKQHEQTLQNKKEKMLYIDRQLEKYAKLNEASLDSMMLERLDKLKDMRKILHQELTNLDTIDTNHTKTFLEEVNRIGKLSI